MELDLKNKIRGLKPSEGFIKNIKGIFVSLISIFIGCIGYLGTYDLFVNIQNWGFLIGFLGLFASTVFFLFGAIYLVGNIKSLFGGVLNE